MGFLEDLGGLLQPVSGAGQGFRNSLGYGNSMAMPKKTAGAMLAVGGAGLVIGTGGAIIGAAAPATPIIGASSSFGSGVASALGIGSLPSWVLPAGVGVGAGALLFGGKKGDQITNQNQYTTSYNTNSQSTSNSNITGDWSTNVISNSPYATMKKGAISGSLTGSPLQNNPLTSNPIQSAEQKSAGTDWATLAAIAGVALVAYGYTSRKGK